MSTPAGADDGPVTPATTDRIAWKAKPYVIKNPEGGLENLSNIGEGQPPNPSSSSRGRGGRRRSYSNRTWGRHSSSRDYTPTRSSASPPPSAPTATVSIEDVIRSFICRLSIYLDE
jgi:hypothetical protein